MRPVVTTITVRAPWEEAPNMCKKPDLKRQGGFTLVEIMIVVLIIGILLGIAVPNFVGARERAWTNTCQENLKKIDHAKMVWAINEGRAPDDTATWDDLVPSILQKEPKCPTHGDYTIGNGNEPATCSKHAR
jgi:prepilin-type N-terminal cleavage/methylation domain-containing protein